MYQQLLVDCNSLDCISILQESTGNKPMIVEGVFGRADEFNKNKRRYSKSILEREVERIFPLMSERKLLGELDHPESRNAVNLSNASHLITEMKWNGNKLLGKAEILNTPSGKIAQSLIRDGVQLGISSRGVGSLRSLPEQEGYSEVNEDFKMITFDLVADPSTRGAYPTLQEGTEIAQSIQEGKKQILSQSIALRLLANKIDTRIVEAKNGAFGKPLSPETLAAIEPARKKAKEDTEKHRGKARNVIRTTKTPESFKDKIINKFKRVTDSTELVESTGLGENRRRTTGDKARIGAANTDKRKAAERDAEFQKQVDAMTAGSRSTSTNTPHKQPKYAEREQDYTPRKSIKTGKSKRIQYYTGKSKGEKEASRKAYKYNSLTKGTDHNSWIGPKDESFQERLGRILLERVGVGSVTKIKKKKKVKPDLSKRQFANKNKNDQDMAAAKFRGDRAVAKIRARKAEFQERLGALILEYDPRKSRTFDKFYPEPKTTNDKQAKAGAQEWNAEMDRQSRARRKTTSPAGPADFKPAYKGSHRAGNRGKGDKLGDPAHRVQKKAEMFMKKRAQREGTDQEKFAKNDNNYDEGERVTSDKEVKKKGKHWKRKSLDTNHEVGESTMNFYERLANTLLELATVDNSDWNYEIIKPFSNSKSQELHSDLGGKYDRGQETEAGGDSDHSKEEGSGVPVTEPGGYGEAVEHLMDRFRDKIK